MFVEIMILLTITILFCSFLIFYMKHSFKSLIDSCQTAILILSNIYAMLILVLLLGHGLFKLPITLWKK
jgi:hypothetical protein